MHGGPRRTLKRKTLDLLFRMTNASNVVFVVDKLLYHLRDTTDVAFRTSLVERITQLAERYAPDNSWYISTMNAVFEHGGELVRADVSHNLMRLIAEGSGDDEDADMELRKYAATTYYNLLAKPKLPDVLIQIVCWVLGEYGYLCDEVELTEIAERLCDAAERQFTEAKTRCWVIVAIVKLVPQLGEAAEGAAELCAKWAASSDVTVATYCQQFEAMLNNVGAMTASLPVDASCEDLEPDAHLAFLDNYVHAALQNGAQPYLAPNDRPDELDVAVKRHDATPAAAADGPGGGGLRFTEYEKPAEPVRTNMYEPTPTAASYGDGGGALRRRRASNGRRRRAQHVWVAAKWGAAGFNAAAGGAALGGGGAAAAAPLPAATRPPRRRPARSRRRRRRRRARPPPPRAPASSRRRKRWQRALRRHLVARRAARRPRRPRRPRRGRGRGGAAVGEEEEEEEGSRRRRRRRPVDLLGGLFDAAAARRRRRPCDAVAARPGARGRRPPLSDGRTRRPRPRRWRRPADGAADGFDGSDGLTPQGPAAPAAAAGARRRSRRTDCSSDVDDAPSPTPPRPHSRYRCATRWACGTSPCSSSRRRPSRCPSPRRRPPRSPATE